MKKIDNLTVGVISDGKYGERAFQNISKKFNTAWITVPEIEPTIMLDDDIELNIPDCDIYLSYARHPERATCPGVAQRLIRKRTEASMGFAGRALDSFPQIPPLGPSGPSVGMTNASHPPGSRDGCPTNPIA